MDDATSVIYIARAAAFRNLATNTRPDAYFSLKDFPPGNPRTIEYNTGTAPAHIDHSFTLTREKSESGRVLSTDSHHIYFRCYDFIDNMRYVVSYMLKWN